MGVITYIRSSSLNNFSFCEQQHFLTYQLGYQSPTGVKTDKGSAVHKVMEELAIIKKKLQDEPDTKEIVVNDKTFTVEELYEVEYLTEEQVAATNKARANKSIYVSDCKIDSKHKRVGTKVVEELISVACAYYSTKSVKEWTKADFRDVREWVYIVLDYLDGEFDPRFQDIVSPEQPFDISLDYLPWSEYEYKIGDEIIRGHLRIKGTIDLVTSESSSTLHIVDYKTGSRIDWATGNEKDLKYLKNDKQLKLYAWAIRKKFPHIKNVLITIFFVRDGGPFTIPFEPETDLEVEEAFRKHFEEVKKTKVPSMCHPKQLDFKCQKLCHFYKTKWPGSNKNMCQYIHDEIKKKGIPKVIEEHKQDGFSLDMYSEPGA